ncbi:hypothetical protein Aduo_008835 [Ancylostoma duodenale]
MPASSTSVQIRGGRRKKTSTNDQQPPNFDQAVELLLNDANLPQHLRVVMARLLDMKEEFSALMAKNSELMEENKSLSNRNNELMTENELLRFEIASLKSRIGSGISLKFKYESDVNTVVPSQNALPISTEVEESECKRSVVIHGMYESYSPVPTLRALHDRQCVHQLLDHLNIPCIPVSVFRLGCPNPNKPRLLKVVFPSSYFARTMVRRGPNLRSFAVRGIFIRHSVPRAERERFKATRQSPTLDAQVSHNSSTNASPSQIDSPSISVSYLSRTETTRNRDSDSLTPEPRL